MLKPSTKCLVACSALLCTAALLALYGEGWLEQWVRRTVKEKIAASPYFKCEEITLDLRPGSIVFRQAVLDLDLVAQGRHLEVKSQAVKLEGIDWFRLLFSKKLEIKHLHIESPFIMLAELVPADSVFLEKQAPKHGITSLHIDHLTAERGRFKTVKHAMDTLAVMTADTFDIDLGDLTFILNKKGFSHHVEQAKMDFRNLAFHSDDQLHRIRLNRLQFNKKDELITLTGLAVKPSYDKRHFFKRLSWKKARLDFDFSNIVFRGWQFDQLLQGKLVARSATISGMALQVLANQNLPIDPKHYEPLPHEALLKASLGITIDSVLVKNGRLEFENIAIGKTKPGLLSFDQLNAIFINVTNDTASIRKQPSLTGDMNAMFQKRHRLDNHIRMDLNSPNYAFTLTGKVAAIPFIQLNPYLTPATNMVFEKGQISSIDYTIKANTKAARGKLNMAYEGLRFSWMNKKNKKSRLLADLLDLFFIKNDNNPMDKNFQKGAIYARRDTRRPFFSYIWAALLSGMKTSILNDFETEKIHKMQSKRSSK